MSLYYFYILKDVTCSKYFNAYYGWMSIIQIRCQFHNLCYNTDLPSLLQCQNYSELKKLLSKLFEHRNKILNQNK